MAPGPSAATIQAARDGNLCLLKEMVSVLDWRGVKGPKGRTLLHFAAAEGHLDVCKFLVEGPRLHVNSTSVEVDDGLTDIVNFLLEVGADDPNIHDGDGKFLIMLAAAHEYCELVEILFPRTKPVPFMRDWSVDGIIRTMKYPHLEPLELVEEKIADSKSQGKEAFAKGDYLAAIYFYDLVKVSTEGVGVKVMGAGFSTFSNRSLCWLRLREGEMAFLDARHCKMLSPRFAKAWYREGAALSLLKNYKGAADAFKGVLKLDPTNNEIKKGMREAIESLKSSARSGEQNPQAAASV